MLKFSILAFLACVLLAAASPCPFRQLQDAATAGTLSKREAEIVEKMKRDPSYIPALDPEAQPLFKRAALPTAEADLVSNSAEEFKPLEKKQSLPSGLPDVCGGLTYLNGNPTLKPLCGILSDLQLPTPQEFGLKEIPGDDAFGQAHHFQGPDSTDVRGGCPTLNTLANHGFLPRNGITSFAGAANAIQIAYGFGYDLSVFLSALGLITGGDLPTGLYSIGGADARVPNTIGPALGLFKHGTFEIDGSITRQDDYFGNEAIFILKRWNALVSKASQYDNGHFGRNLFAQERKTTYDTARSTNPYFNAGAKQFAVSLAERAFVYRALPNGTNPGVADFQNISPFFLDEKFPKNWFRRATPYGLANLGPDLVDLYTANPTPLGANEGGTNNFVPYNAPDLGTTPNSYLCFILENLFDTAPGQVQPTLLNNLNLFFSFANAVVAPFFEPFGCPALVNYTLPGDGAGSPVKGKNP